MSDLTPEVRLRSARRSLIATMEAYGIDDAQAKIQVRALEDAVRADERSETRGDGA